MILNFPDNFLFGSATSSFQIEGHPHAKGAQPSIWNTFCKKKFAVKNGHNGTIACNHYELWEKDLEIIRRLNLDSYRFSVAWPRILPAGEGPPNEKGLDFYEQLTDRLLEYDITPMLTLYHWDLPEHLQAQGGWAHPQSPDWFASYTRAVASRLSDRIPLWVTFNEPWVFMHLGMVTGEHAPGYKDPAHAAMAWKHILLAHSRSVETLRSCSESIEVGLACNISPFIPASSDEKDIQATSRMEAYHNRLFLDPWLKGSFPDVADHAFGRHTPAWTESERSEAATEIDFLGINYYSPNRIAHQSDTFLEVGIRPPKPPVTDMNWEIYPEGLHEVLEWAFERYGPLDLYVTENGCAYTDSVGNGIVKDDRRILYFMNHLEQCSKAVSDGIPLKGYYAWSLLDNFEWSFGYEKRFGIVHVDFSTQQRIIKNSGYFYRDFISSVKEGKKELVPCEDPIIFDKHESRNQLQNE